MAAKKRRPATPKVCPVCDEDVPSGALACPSCGADHNSGWKEDALIYDGLDLPEDNFSYDEFMEREFGRGRGGLPIKPVWLITAILLLVAFLLATLRF